MYVNVKRNMSHSHSELDIWMHAFNGTATDLYICILFICLLFYLQRMYISFSIKCIVWFLIEIYIFLMQLELLLLVSSQIIPLYYIECQKTCLKATLQTLRSHDSKNCTECYQCVKINVAISAGSNSKPHTTDVAISARHHYTPQSTDAQQWYIEYLHGQSENSFLIVSKLNGKALYCKGGDGGLQVKATERNDDDDRQHWKRKDSYIVSKKWNKILYKQPKTHQLFLLYTDVDNHSRSNVRAMFAIKKVSL